VNGHRTPNAACDRGVGTWRTAVGPNGHQAQARPQACTANATTAKNVKAPALAQHCGVTMRTSRTSRASRLTDADPRLGDLVCCAQARRLMSRLGPWLPVVLHQGAPRGSVLLLPPVAADAGCAAATVDRCWSPAPRPRSCCTDTAEYYVPSRSTDDFTAFTTAACFRAPGMSPIYPEPDLVRLTPYVVGLARRSAFGMAS